MNAVNSVLSGFRLALLAPITIVICLLVLGLGAVPSLHDRTLSVARLWGRLCVLVCGCRLVVSGADHIDPEQRYMVMANHQSAFDILVLLAVLPAQLRVTFWAKKSLFEIPLFGWAMRSLGYVPIDREQRLNASRMFLNSLDISRNGKSMLVFPEETYATDETLLPFQRGGFLFAIKAGSPILPIGIKGTRIALAPNSQRLVPTTITVSIGQAIPTDQLKVSDRAELTETVRSTLIELSGAAPDS